MSDDSDCNCEQALELAAKVGYLKLKLGQAFDTLLTERAETKRLLDDTGNMARAVVAAEAKADRLLAALRKARDFVECQDDPDDRVAALAAIDAALAGGGTGESGE